MSVLYGVLVLLFGAAVGASELIARYRDAPFFALRTVPAWWYIFVNAAASLGAYALIVVFDQKFGIEDAGQAAMVQALVAGFGAMVFFRSSLFTIKVGETDVGVGPAIFFQVLLFATDRAVDRERAQPRSVEVGAIMRGVSFEAAREALPNFCFELMQNVPAAEMQRFRQVVDALASSRMRDPVKVLNLGLMLMNVVGGKVLSAAVLALGEKIQGPARLELDVFSRLQTADFDKAFPLLVDVAFVMSKYKSGVDQEGDKKAVLEELRGIANQPDLDNGSKMTILGLSLQQRVGDAVLLTALVYLDDGIRKPGAASAVTETPAAGPAEPVAPAEPTAPAGVGATDTTVVPFPAADEPAPRERSGE
jgi:hypothetical protein